MPARRAPVVTCSSEPSHAGFGALVAVAAIEHIRLDRAARQQPAAADVGAREPIAVAALVELVVERAHDRRGKHIDLRGRRPDRHARRIEGARGVDPARVADQPLIAEGDLLAPGPQRDRGLRAADIDEALTEIERGRERRAGRSDALAADSRVLDLDGRGHVRPGRRRREADARQEVGIVSFIDEAGIAEAFDALAKLSAHAEPRGHHLVGAVRERRAIRRCRRGTRELSRRHWLGGSLRRLAGRRLGTGHAGRCEQGGAEKDGTRDARGNSRERTHGNAPDVDTIDTSGAWNPEGSRRAAALDRNGRCGADWGVRGVEADIDRGANRIPGGGGTAEGPLCV